MTTEAVNPSKKMGSVDKLLDIPMVNSVASGINTTYSSVKNLNSLTQNGFYYVEKGTELVVTTAYSPLQRPIAVVDNIICVTLDRLKVRIPIMYQTPTEIIQTSKGLLFGSFIAQKLLGLMEIGCRVSETFLNAVPEVNLYEEIPDGNLSDEKTTLKLRTDLSLWKKRYHSTTKPLRYLKHYLRKLRKSLRTIRYTYKKRSRKQMTPDLIEKIKLRNAKEAQRRRKSDKGLVGFFLSIPRRLLRIIGEMAHEYSKMVADKNTIIIDKALKKFENTQEGRKIVRAPDTEESDDQYSEDESVVPSSLRSTPSGSVDYGSSHFRKLGGSVGGGEVDDNSSTKGANEPTKENSLGTQENTSESGEQETISTRDTSPMNDATYETTSVTEEVETTSVTEEVETTSSVENLTEEVEEISEETEELEEVEKIDIASSCEEAVSTPVEPESPSSSPEEIETVVALKQKEVKKTKNIKV